MASLYGLFIWVKSEGVILCLDFVKETYVATYLTFSTI